MECILAYDATKVAALLSRVKKGNRRVKKGNNVDNVQYFATKEFVVLAAQRQCTSVQLKARLKNGEADDGFTVLLQSAARAFDNWDACRNDVSPQYAHEYMVNDCTDVLVAFRHEEPVAFALLEKTLTKTSVGILCASQTRGRGAGQLIMSMILEEAQRDATALTLSALPSVVSYYTGKGFSFGKDCADEPVQLDNAQLASTRIRMGDANDASSYDYSEVAPLLQELHRKNLAASSDRKDCTSENMTFADLEERECHLRGYYMMKCPGINRVSRKDLMESRNRNDRWPRSLPNGKVQLVSRQQLREEQKRERDGRAKPMRRGARRPSAGRGNRTTAQFNSEAACRTTT